MLSKPEIIRSQNQDIAVFLRGEQHCIFITQMIMVTAPRLESTNNSNSQLRPAIFYVHVCINYLILTLALWGKALLCFPCYRWRIWDTVTSKDFLLWIMLLPSTQWSLWSITGDVGEEDFQWHGNHSYGYQFSSHKDSQNHRGFMINIIQLQPDSAQRRASSSGKSPLPSWGLRTLFFLLPGLSHDRNSHCKWVYLVYV